MSANKRRLPEEQSQRLGNFIRKARELRGWTRNDLCDRMCPLLGPDECPDFYWVKWIENGPPQPFSSVDRWDAMLFCLGLGWPEVHRILRDSEEEMSIDLDPYQRGQLAQAAGAGRASCPYPEDHWTAREWLGGYSSGPSPS